MRALRELANIGFHYRNCLEDCLNRIARLDSYIHLAPSRNDSPIKIRQDMLATQDVVNLSLSARRLVEITNSRKYAKQLNIGSFELIPKNTGAEVIKERIDLYELLGRIIHARTCLACRNILSIVGHFNIRSIPKSLVEGEMATKPVLIVQSDKTRKRVCELGDFSVAVYKIIESLARNDQCLTQYLETRNF